MPSTQQREDEAQLPLDFQAMTNHRYRKLATAIEQSNIRGSLRELIVLIFNITKSSSPGRDFLAWEMQKIADDQGYSRSTARRNVRKAVDSGLVTDATPWRAKSARCHTSSAHGKRHLTIAWARVDEIFSRQQAGQIVCENVEVRAKNSPTAKDSNPCLNLDFVPTVAGRLKLSSPQTKLSSPQTISTRHIRNNKPFTQTFQSTPTISPKIAEPPCRTVIASPVAVGEEGEGILKQLKTLGLSYPARCVEAAIERGCTLELIGQVVEHYQSKPGAWGSGALFNHIRAMSGKDDPATNWPRPAEEYLMKMSAEKRQSERDESERIMARRHREKQERIEMLADEAKDDAARETAFGGALDVMAAAEKAELKKRAIGDINPGFLRPDPLRRMMLIQLTREHNCR